MSGDDTFFGEPTTNKQDFGTMARIGLWCVLIAMVVVPLVLIFDR